MNRPKNQICESESDASSEEGQSPQEHEVREKTVNSFQEDDNDFDGDVATEFRGPTISQKGQRNFPPRDHYVFIESHHTRWNHHMGDAAVFSPNDRVDGAKLPEIDKPYRHPIPSEDPSTTSTLLPNFSSHSSST